MPADSSMKQKFHAAFLFSSTIMHFPLPFFSIFHPIPKPHQVYVQLNLI
jgi:hypothetical protein